jgi:hypothetical protein
MKIFIISLLALMNSSHAYFGDEVLLEEENPTVQKSPSDQFIKDYCVMGKGKVIGSPSIGNSASFTCEISRSPYFFYESWKGQNVKGDINDLNPKIEGKELQFYENSYAILLALEDKDPNYKKCVEESKIDPYKFCKELEHLKTDLRFKTQVASIVNSYGKSVDQIKQQVLGKTTNQEVKPVVDNTTIKVVIPDKKSDKKEVVTTVTPKSVNPGGENTKKEEKVDDKTIVTNEKKTVKTDEKVDVKVVDPVNPDPDCKEELKTAIAALLEDDKKNIIGLQYELTVLKMASASVESGNNTLEGLIRKQSKKIQTLDTGVIEKMNAMYKEHGLSEDKAALANHLKEKATAASYFAKDKRFFNKDSAAFLLAHQHLNPNSGINDADISVLWFMDKVSEKAQTKYGKYQAQHNLTNLSTRVAQYTGYIKGKNAIPKEDLIKMVADQKSKIDSELLQIMQSFKESNLACYTKLFGEGEANPECGMAIMNAAFSELIDINSKIDATSQISLDTQLKGGLNKTRFSIAPYIATTTKPERIETRPVIENKVVVKENKKEVIKTEVVADEDDKDLLPVNINIGDQPNPEDMVEYPLEK